VNRAQKMLEVLADGQPHSQRELWERGGFYLTNNAAAELRAQGYDVRYSQERIDGKRVHFYRLHGSLSEASLSAASSSSSPEGHRTHDPHGGRGASQSEQERLFNEDRKPAWA